MFIAIALTLAAIVVSSATFAALFISKDIPLRGSITTNVSADLGIYSDSDCQNVLASIDVGDVIAGTQTNQTFYIKNLGSVALTLGMTVSNWQPSEANGVIAIVWNQQNTVIQPGDKTEAIVTVTVPSATTLTSFNVQLSITGTGS